MTENNDNDRFQQLWDARLSALESLFGPSGEKVFHATIPLFMGGSADVLEFPSHIPGKTYVTANLVGDSGQVESSLGQYELMMCTRQADDWAPNLISRLASYAVSTVLEPGETMDIDSAVPKDSTIQALLFTVPEIDTGRLAIEGQSFGLLLCLGITNSELQSCLAGRTQDVLQRLKDKGVFPYTDHTRKAVV